MSNQANLLRCSPHSRLLVDTGVAHVRLRTVDAAGRELDDAVFSSNRDFSALLAERRVKEIFGEGESAPVSITGKVRPMVRRALGGGKVFMPAAVLWLAAADTAAAAPAGKSLAAWGGNRCD